jgi:hypothetical protein
VPVFDRLDVVVLSGDDDSKRFDDPVAVLGVEVLRDLFADQFLLIVSVEAFDRRTLVQYHARRAQQGQQIGRVQRQPPDRWDTLQFRSHP